MKMVEELARAFCQADGLAEDELVDGEPRWKSYTLLARAGILACRNPNETELAATMAPDQLAKWQQLRDLWQGVIDDALDDRPRH